jgi:cytidine deaminase
MGPRFPSEQRDLLIEVAQKAACAAYAPYSRFRVGAAVLEVRGLYRGANVENCSYGLTLCAERSALAAAVANGDPEILAIAVACIDASADQCINDFLPCGACRQWMAELAPNAEIIISGKEEAHSFQVQELLPFPFRLKSR